jgi:hypothetical protein
MNCRNNNKIRPTVISILSLQIYKKWPGMIEFVVISGGKRRTVA